LEITARLLDEAKEIRGEYPADLRPVNNDITTALLLLYQAN
jgi:hypothetical protein